MSLRQRMVPLMLATFVGVASGMYIFDPLLKQYAVDSRGTYDPKIAQAGNQGGIGGGISGVTDLAKANAENIAQEPSRIISGLEARKKLTEMMNAGKQKTQVEAHTKDSKAG